MTDHERLMTAVLSEEHGRGPDSDISVLDLISTLDTLSAVHHYAELVLTD